MGKLIGLVIVGVIAFAWFQSAPRKASQPTSAADPIADMQARLKAEQERLRAEDDARGKASAPAAAPSPALSTGPSSADLAQELAKELACTQAQLNIGELERAARAGGKVVEYRSGADARVLGPGEIPAAIAENREAIKANCRGK